MKRRSLAIAANRQVQLSSNYAVGPTPIKPEELTIVKITSHEVAPAVLSPPVE
jgi:hypothetical protein